MSTPARAVDPLLVRDMADAITVLAAQIAAQGQPRTYSLATAIAACAHRLESAAADALEATE